MSWRERGWARGGCSGWALGPGVELGRGRIYVPGSSAGIGICDLLNRYVYPIERWRHGDCFGYELPSVLRGRRVWLSRLYHIDSLRNAKQVSRRRGWGGQRDAMSRVTTVLGCENEKSKHVSSTATTRPPLHSAVFFSRPPRMWERLSLSVPGLGSIAR